MPFRRALSVLSSVLVALAVSAASAHAALPVTFESLANDTEITNQFAADGITFLGVPDGATGLPRVADVGARANSGTKIALSQCFACEFVHNSIKGQLSSFRETVSVRAGINTLMPVSVLLRLEGMNAAGTVIVSTDNTIGAATNFKTLMTVDGPGTDDIAFFRLRTVNGGDAGYQFGIDDVTYTGGGGAADFSVSPSTSGVRIRQGGTATLPVNIFRFNASNGNVTMSAAGLTAGVTLGGFAPNPVGGSSTASTTMTLNASNTATVGTSFTPSVVGTPAGALTGPAPRSGTFPLTVEKAFDVFLPDQLRLPSCGSVTTNVSVNRALSGYTAPINLAVSGLPAGYSATLGSTTVTDPGDGTFSTSVPLTVTRVGAGSLTDTSVTVTASSGALPSASDTAAVRRFAGEVTGFTPGSGNIPRDLRPGTAVTLVGQGFCPGSRVRFGADTTESIPEEIDPSGTSLRVRVPRYATSGPLTVVAPDGAFASSGAFAVQSPRASEGFAFNNYSHDGVGLSEVRDLYGADQTNITLDLCWPFGCNVVTPIPSPLTGLYILISNAMLEGNGSCFGVAVASQHITTGQAPISQFAAAGATTAWQLDATSGPAAQLRRRIRTWHTAQLSSRFLQNWLGSAATNLATGGSGTRGRIEAELTAGRNPLVTLRKGGGGHVVVAHDVRPGADGGYLVDVYDPNVEFVGGENTDAAGHRSRMDVSTITVRPGGGWTHPGAYAGGAWSGSADAMIAAPLSLLGTRPLMPTTLSGIASLIVPFADGAGSVAQVTDSRGRKLLDRNGELNTNAGTRIPDATIAAGLVGSESGPLYLVDADGTYTQTLVGSRSGTTGTAMFGPGFAAHLTGIATRKGNDDRVRIDAGDGELDVDASRGGNLRARLARGLRGGVEAGADVQIAGGDAGDHGFRLDPRGSGFTYDNNGSGPATAAVTLSWSGRDGVPGSTTLPPIAVPRGGRAEIQPATWSQLAGSRVRIIVRDARGRVVRRLTFRPKAGSRRVSQLRIAARTDRGKRRVVTVRASFAGAPRGAKAVVGLHVRKGNKLVATRTLNVSARRGKRNFTFRLALAAGNYSIRGSAGVIVTGRGFTVSRTSAKRSFRAR